MAVLDALLSAAVCYPVNSLCREKPCCSFPSSRFEGPKLSCFPSPRRQLSFFPSSSCQPHVALQKTDVVRVRNLNRCDRSRPTGRRNPERASSTDVFESDPFQAVDEESPAELGAVIFKRSATNTHYEYATTLEKLDLVSYSSEYSKKLGDAMGLGQSEDGTPVSVSFDVVKERRDLRLSGMVRTALGLQCSWCLDPLAERVYAEVDLLLTVDPPSQPTSLQAGAVLDSNLQARQFSVDDDDVEGAEELDLDLDDKLHFPAEAKEIDLSTYIRDTVHLNIPIMAQCSDSCRGCCLKCGLNLNRNTCDCEAEGGAESSGGSNWGPLRDLSKKMKRRPKK